MFVDISIREFHKQDSKTLIFNTTVLRRAPDLVNWQTFHRTIGPKYEKNSQIYFICSNINSFTVCSL